MIEVIADPQKPLWWGFSGLVFGALGAQHGWRPRRFERSGWITVRFFGGREMGEPSPSAQDVLVGTNRRRSTSGSCIDARTRALWIRAGTRLESLRRL